MLAPLLPTRLSWVPLVSYFPASLILPNSLNSSIISSVFSFTFSSRYLFLNSLINWTHGLLLIHLPGPVKPDRSACTWNGMRYTL